MHIAPRAAGRESNSLDKSRRELPKNEKEAATQKGNRQNRERAQYIQMQHSPLHLIIEREKRVAGAGLET